MSFGVIHPVFDIGAADRLVIDAAVQRPYRLREPAKRELLSCCRCVVYTPEDEHCGLVRLETMAAGKPIIAVGTGGSLDTILDGETGWQCAPTATRLAAALASVHGRHTAAAAINSPLRRAAD